MLARRRCAGAFASRFRQGRVAREYILGGQTGLTVAICAARVGIDTLVVERGGFGGQAGLTERLDNYLPSRKEITGEEFV